MYTCSFLFLLLCTMFTVWALPPIDIMLDYSCSNDHRKHIAYPIIFARWTLNTGHTVYNSICFVCVHIIFVSFFVASFVENTFLCCSNWHWMWNLTSTLIIYRISDWWEREREKTIGFIGLCISQKYPLSFAVSLTIVIAIIIRLAIMRSFNYKARASSARPVPLNEYWINTKKKRALARCP